MSIAMARFVSIASNERRTFLILASHSENVILKFLNKGCARFAEIVLGCARFAEILVSARYCEVCAR